jgi:phosphatidylglycerol:prolipoprotein diacylglycerol transferase
MLWLFLAGIVGARIVYIYEEWHKFAGSPFWRFFTLWDGGLTFYGAMFGGALAYYVFWYRVLRKQGVSNWKMADVVAPCLALGACLGRIGCLLTGCCFGNVACPDCWSINFPVPNGPNLKMTYEEGYQTPLGFLLARDGSVGAVENHSAAQRAGIQSGDVLLKINSQPIETIKNSKGDPVLTDAVDGLRYYLTEGWPRGQQEVYLQVLRDGAAKDLPPFRAWGLGVLPTQIFESISMVLLLFFLLSYHPFKLRDGSLLVFMMTGYGLHRFLNEMLRSDNAITWSGLTLSQNISVAILLGATVLAYFVWRRPVPPQAAAEVCAEPVANGVCSPV